MFDRKANNSVLFSLTRRKSIQFLGITVDPGFEIGGAQNARLSTRKFFSVPHSCTFKSTIRFGHLGIIKKHEVVENYNFEAFCGHCC